MAITENEIFARLTSAMIKTQNGLKAFMRQKLREQNIDLTVEMLQVLIHLWKKEGINQQELANLLHKDKANMTYLIDNLSKRNLVQRSEDPVDRRNNLITLTPEGLSLKDLIRPSIKELYTVGGKDIPDETLEKGIALFERICSNLAAAVK